MQWMVTILHDFAKILFAALKDKIRKPYHAKKLKPVLIPLCGWGQNLGSRPLHALKTVFVFLAKDSIKSRTPIC
jgi:hypothetical protein